ncbi:MAG TPA: energy transducer TonB [Thermoanaerobaculia bacterium]|nr:energy transducer TonB [Thermoanaerobaculia bacterium]
MFEHSLIDLEAKPKPRRWLSLPIAVGLHVVGITAFAFASYWNVGSVPEPQVADVFVVSLPPPLAGGGGGEKPKPQPQEQKKQAAEPEPQKTVQPNLDKIPEKPAAPAANDTIQDLRPAGPGPSDPSTGCEGCPPGPGIGPGPAGPGDKPGVDPGPGIGVGDTMPIHLSVGMTKPEVIHQVQPRYSEMARRAGVQGTVIVEAVIDAQGQVTNVRLLRGLPMGLDQAAVDAIRQWRFKPAQLDGHPVKVYFTLTVNFSLQR